VIFKARFYYSLNPAKSREHFFRTSIQPKSMFLSTRKNASKASNMNQRPIKLRPFRIFLGVLIAGAYAGTAWAGNLPSGTVSGSGSGPYIYDLTFSDSAGATSPIGSVWYGWVPPVYDYLPGTPTSVSVPTGWNYLISGQSIEFSASSSTFDIQPGSTLSGFSYTAAFSPSTLAGSPAAAYSYAYVGGIEGDPGSFFSVKTVVPEPSAAAFFGMSALGLGLARWRRQ
jgi:hypothetical protein